METVVTSGMVTTTSVGTASTGWVVVVTVLVVCGVCSCTVCVVVVVVVVLEVESVVVAEAFAVVVDGGGLTNTVNLESLSNLFGTHPRRFQHFESEERNTTQSQLQSV
jgi:hypothetical protein